MRPGGWNRTPARWAAGVAVAAAGFAIAEEAGEALTGELEELVVKTVKEPRLLGVSSSLTADDLLERGSFNLVDAFQREPNVSIPFDVAGQDPLVPYLEGGAQAINIRGLEGNRVAMMVDGIRQPEDFVSRSFDGAGGPGRIYFDPAVFARLDLFKTARSDQFGSDALGGAVLGVTESPFTLLDDGLAGSTGSLHVNWASANRSWHERVAGAVGNGDFATSVVYSRRDGHELENNESVPQNPAEFSSDAVVWTSVARLGEWTLVPTVDWFRAESFTELNSIEGGVSLIGRTLLADLDNTRERLRFSVDVEHRPTVAKFAYDELAAKLYWQHATGENLNRQEVETVNGLRRRRNELIYDTAIQGLNLNFRKDFSTGPVAHQLSYGYGGSLSEIESGLLRTDFPAAPSDLPGMAPSEVVRHTLSIADTMTFGGADEWSLTASVLAEDYRVEPENTPAFLRQTQVPVFDPVLGLLIGTRSVRAVEYRNLAFAPGVDLSRRFGRDWRATLRASRGFRNPSAEELAGVFVHPDAVSITLPNPELQEERSQSFELSLRKDTPEWLLEITGFYNRYDNFLQPGVPTGEVLDGLQVLRTENTRDVELYGIELLGEWSVGEWQPVLDGVAVGASFGWTRGTFGAADGSRQPLDTVEPPKTVGWVRYRDPDDHWGVELTATYVADKDAEDISGPLVPTDEFLLLDLIGYRRLGEHVTLRAGLKNLLDESYVIWARANRGDGHGGAGGILNTQPGVNAFLGVELAW